VNFGLRHSEDGSTLDRPQTLEERRLIARGAGALSGAVLARRANYLRSETANRGQSGRSDITEVAMGVAKAGSIAWFDS
jgi:hypothetical protein